MAKRAPRPPSESDARAPPHPGSHTFPAAHVADGPVLGNLHEASSRRSSDLELPPVQSEDPAGPLGQRAIVRHQHERAAVPLEKSEQ
jgi:hypothetical protein